MSEAPPLPGASILISNRQSEPVDEEGLATLAREVLAGEEAGVTELSLSFVTSEEITDLHVRYMNEEGPTDVLSFEMDEQGEGGETKVLGDVVVAPAEAAKNNPDVEAELRLLLVHGILHLLGYDHEEAADRAAMWQHQERYVETKVP